MLNPTVLVAEPPHSIKVPLIDRLATREAYAGKVAAWHRHRQVLQLYPPAPVCSHDADEGKLAAVQTALVAKH